MFRNILIGIIVFGFIVAVVQLTRVVFSDTLDGGALTVASLSAGIVLAFFLGFLQREPNYPMNAMFAIFVSVIAVASINKTFSGDSVHRESFVVSKIGYKRVRYDDFPYVKLTNQDGSTEYSVTSEGANDYSVGDEVVVGLKEGFWGFKIIVSVN